MGPLLKITLKHTALFINTVQLIVSLASLALAIVSVWHLRVLAYCTGSFKLTTFALFLSPYLIVWFLFLF
jgi:hypothetical protein